MINCKLTVGQLSIIIMIFGTLLLPLTLPFPFSDYLLSVPLSGQFFFIAVI